MLNTMVAMLLGAEQAGVHLVPSGKAESEGMSFAKSFDEGVLAVDAKAAVATDKRAAAMPGLQSGVPVTASDGLVALPDHAKNMAIVGQGATAMATLEDGQSVALAKSVSVGTSVAAGKSVDGTGTGLGSLRASPACGRVQAGVGSADAGKSAVVTSADLDSAQVKQIADAAGPVQGEVSGVPVGGDVSSAQNSVPTAEVVSVAQADRPVLGRGEECGAKQAITGTGAVKPESVSPMKKTAKGQEGAAEAKIVHKVAGTAKSVTVGVTKASTVMDVQTNAVAVSAGAVVSAGTEQNGTGKASEGSSSVVVPAGLERSAGVVSATNGKGGKEGARPGKVSTEDAKPAVMAADDSGASSAKSGSEFAKAVAFASRSGVDGDGKIQGANAGLVHTAAGGAGIVPGLVAGVAPVHVAADVTSAKLQSGEAGGHATTLHAASGEADGIGGMAAASTDGTQRTLVATPTSLEVGIANGTHGWLKIRAEMASGGVVNASLSTASSAGQEMLHRELPSLTAYLQQEQVAVNAVVVHAPVAGTESHGAAAGVGGDGSGRQAQQGDGRGGEGRQGTASAGLNYTDEVAYEGSNGVGADGLLLPLAYAGGGSWLSVRA